MAHYVIGDVQGCYKELLKLTKKIKFNPDKDKLIFAGDLVNRGDESLEVMEFCMQNKKSIKAVLGNHDFYLLYLIENKKMPKGDPITLAEISAVLGVKKTSELIPLCHPLPIDHTATKIIMHDEDNSLEVFCVVSAVAKTGVEMEAIMGVNAALITIYDLSKIVNPHLKIDNVKLLIKEGGKSGLWTNPDGLPELSLIHI